MPNLLSAAKTKAAIDYNQRRGLSAAEIKAVQKCVGVTADGEWGGVSVNGVAAWQKAHDLDVDGKIGPVTLPKIIAESPQKPAPKPLHPLPAHTERWGYDHSPDVWHKPDPQWAALTGNGSFAAAVLRLVSGYEKENGKTTFSRGPDSWISLDELSIGFAHWWSDTAPGLLAEIATRAPTESAWAWGKAVAPRMRDERWLDERIETRRGKGRHKPEYDWLLSGWYEIARHPAVIRVCVAQWLESYTPAAFAVMGERRWERADTAAALVRLTNSRGDGGMRRLIRRAADLANSKDERKVIETAYFYNAAVVRVDGTTPRFVHEL